MRGESWAADDGARHEADASRRLDAAGLRDSSETPRSDAALNDDGRGDLDPLIAAAFNFGAVRDPEGAIHVRFADHPWGPWSGAEARLRGGNPYDQTLDGQYVEGGLLFHPACEGAGCIAGEPPTVLDPSFERFGRLYGPNIIDCWTESRGDQVDLYWSVSTWNPYQVALMKTRIKRTH